jgi:hypothetical protein
VNRAAAIQFGLVRILLGLYVLWYVGGLLPYAAEHFSNAGMLPDPRLNETYGFFPNPLAVWDSPEAITACLGVLAVLALLLTCGVARRPVAVVLWFGWACLYNRNNLTLNPSLHYVGWLLLACAVIPPGEPFALWSKPRPDWFLPKPLIIGAWLLLAAGYSISGYVKLPSPSWLDGSTVWRVLQGPLAQPGPWRDLVLGLPLPLLQALTWGTLALELFFAPLCVFHRTRRWVWWAAVVWHLGIILLTRLVYISLGMLLMHAFTFDLRWMRRHDHGETSPWFRVRGLC